MNLFWKIVFWTLTIGLGFVNPLITFVMVILYYLPGVIENICNDDTQSNSQTERKSESPQNQEQMKEFSKDVLEKFK